MTTLTKASAQWSSRPADQRFTSLDDMFRMMSDVRERSLAEVVNVRDISVIPTSPHEIAVATKHSALATPTHWSFGQLSQLGRTPADYLRHMGEKGGAELVADNVNFGLRFLREQDEAQLYQSGDCLLAATGPRYERIYNSDIVDHLRKLFGNGADGSWRVPGEFRQRVDITKQNTTLYASDRDMFVFLANEESSIELPRRRNGQPGHLARGFFCWNSEVGSRSLGVAQFLFDYVCSNRMIWGAEQYAEITVRHSVGAAERWLTELKPALLTYANSSTHKITDGIEAARQAKIETDVSEFMATRFGRRNGATMQSIHQIEEERPIETLWDSAVAATAFARTIENTDRRIEVEREAGRLIKLAA